MHFITPQEHPDTHEPKRGESGDAGIARAAVFDATAVSSLTGLRLSPMRTQAMLRTTSSSVMLLLNGKERDTAMRSADFWASKHFILSS